MVKRMEGNNPGGFNYKSSEFRGKIKDNKNVDINISADVVSSVARSVANIFCSVSTIVESISSVYRDKEVTERARYDYLKVVEDCNKYKYEIDVRYKAFLTALKSRQKDKEVYKKHLDKISQTLDDIKSLYISVLSDSSSSDKHIDSITEALNGTMQNYRIIMVEYFDNNSKELNIDFDKEIKYIESNKLLGE